MKYTVVKPFKNIDGSFLKPGDTIEADNGRAAALRANGLIGSLTVNPQEMARLPVPETASVEPPETAVQPKPKAKAKPKKKAGD